MCARWSRSEGSEAAGKPLLNDALVQQMLQAADEDRSGDLDEDEFVHSIAVELKRIRTSACHTARCVRMHPSRA